MTKTLNGFLNATSMYRLVLFYVSGLVAAAFSYGYLGWYEVDINALAFSSAVILAASWLANRLFATALRVPVNTESIWITALILILIMDPVTSDDTEGLLGLVVAATAAIGSKFVLAFGRKHIFNPVALGAVASGYLLDQPPSWWAGNEQLLPFVLIGGLLVVHKVQRYGMVSAYLLANIATVMAFTDAETYLEALDQTLRYSPLLFAGFAMLTEPLTAPQNKYWRIAFAALIGVLSAPELVIGEFGFTPEAAFLAGNLLSFAVSTKYRYKLTLTSVEKLASGCYEYVFAPSRPVRFVAGQYMDWTLDVRGADSRGNRRPFTIASAPGDGQVRLGVKFYPRPSAFKRSLIEMKPGDVIYASHPGGDFTLPSNPREKLVFIAGGIGITPFRSMIEDMISRGDKRQLVMFYGNNRAEEIAYADTLNRAERALGMRTIHVVRDNPNERTNMRKGFIDKAMIAAEVPDFRDHTFFVSGPNAMVRHFQDVLAELGVARSRIKVDYFPGFA